MCIEIKRIKMTLETLELSEIAEFIQLPRSLQKALQELPRLDAVDDMTFFGDSIEHQHFLILKTLWESTWLNTNNFWMPLGAPDEQEYFATQTFVCRDNYHELGSCTIVLSPIVFNL